jgi:hypothetical protein
MPGASIYALTNCLAVPTYGPLLPTQRLCNDSLQLPASGTFVTSAYPRFGARQPPPASGNIASVRLAIPTGTALPEHVRAYVVADVFPLAQATF